MSKYYVHRAYGPSMHVFNNMTLGRMYEVSNAAWEMPPCKNTWIKDKPAHMKHAGDVMETSAINALYLAGDASPSDGPRWSKTTNIDLRNTSP